MNYELTQHARDALTERAIPVEWVERVMISPARTEPDKADPGTVHHLGEIPEHGNRVLRVVINQPTSPVRIVTAYFDRAMKGKL
jgi:hypothetical protein